jgi:hypothetical protein
MSDEIQQIKQGAKRGWPLVMGWVGGITALIGLFASLAGGAKWFVNHHKQKAEVEAKIALAQAEAKQAEYQASLQSDGDILKADPSNRPALDQQLTTAMLWVEDFHVSAREGQDAADPAALALDQIFPILDAGMTRSKGATAADVQAHIGWAHWLNRHIAEREFGTTAEDDLRAALVLDPTNVYANAMLGNWILQNGGNLSEAIQYLDAAVATGKARPFVRKLQLGALIYHDEKGARAALVKAVTEIRKSGEPLDDSQKRRILGFCFDPVTVGLNDFAESLSAVPPDEASKTYLWLDNMPEDAQSQREVSDFIAANLLELAGKRKEALEKYRLLQQQLANQSGSFKNSVDGAIARSSQT